MVSLQKGLQVISLLSILIFIPGIVHGQSLSEIEKQLDEENLEKAKQVTTVSPKDPDFGKLVCPEGSYYGLDNLGNEACRDILTNQIVNPVEEIIPESDAEVIDSDVEVITDSGRRVTFDSDAKVLIDSDKGELIVSDEKTDYSGYGILGLIGAIAGSGFVFRKKIVPVIFQKRGWSQAEKEQVRDSQYGRCYICYRTPSRWVYDHIDGDKRNNDISNCQGLCPECKSEKNLIKI